MQGVRTYGIDNLSELSHLAELTRLNGRNIVLVLGAWDLFHSGHARYLEDAARLGKALFVGVDSDDLVRRAKGDDRPIMGQEERLSVITAMASVDVAFIYDNLPPVMRAVQPSIFVVSTTKEQNNVLWDRQALAREVGATIKCVESRSPVHTTDIIRDIVRRFGPK